MHDAIAVIRALGERTIGVCYELILRQLPKERIRIVQGEAYLTAIRKTYRAGIESGARWMIVVDADRYIRDDAVQVLTHTAEEEGEDLFQLRGLTLDKFFGGPKDGSIRIYRTAYLEEALLLVPTSLTGIRRPDNYVLNQMKQRGYREKRVDGTTFCLHDFEQSYRDIYRKALLHALKHQPYLGLLMPMWQRLAATDFDYQVMLWGVTRVLSEGFDGMLASDDSPLDLASLLAAWGQAEKPPLTINTSSFSNVSQFLEEYSPPPEYGPIRELMGTRQSGRTRWQNFRVACRHLGPVRAIPWAVGRGLSSLGKKLMSGSAAVQKSTPFRV